MIKKITFLVLASISLLLLVAITLNTCQQKIKDEGLSLIKGNNYTLDGEERQIKQILYFTKDNCFNTKDAIDSISFTNEEESKKISLKIKDVKKTNYIHKYENTKYYSYEYILTLPIMSNDFKIERAFIKIFSKEEHIKYEIGSLYLLYAPEVGEASNISINSMLGHATYNPYQTLEYLDIKLENKDNKNIDIIGIWIDDNISLSSNVNNTIFNDEIITFNDTIIGYMEKNYRWYFSYKEHKILDTTFIVIEYMIDNEAYRYVIDTYCFYENGYFVPNDDSVVRTYTNNGRK